MPTWAPLNFIFWSLGYPSMNKGKVGHVDLIQLVMIHRFLPVVGHIDLFSTVSKYFYSGMDKSSTPFGDSQIVKYSHILPQWPEWEEA